MLFCILVIPRTMSSVSSIQSLDLCFAYHSVVVTPLHLQILNKDYTESCLFVSFPWEYSGGYSIPECRGRSPVDKECSLT